MYVLDTGIRSTHAEFWDAAARRSRVADGYDAVSATNSTEDCHGHGTHVAAIVGGEWGWGRRRSLTGCPARAGLTPGVTADAPLDSRARVRAASPLRPPGNTFGVAKNVTLHAVRVLACDGTAMVSSLLKVGAAGAGGRGPERAAGRCSAPPGRPAQAARRATHAACLFPPAARPGARACPQGLEWVARHHAKPAVVHMSIEGGFSSVVNQAVEQLTRVQRVHVVVSSGNSGRDACRASPASAPSAVTVAALDANLARWAYANW